MSYTVNSNGTVEFDWEKKTPEEIREELSRQEAEARELPAAA